MPHGDTSDFCALSIFALGAQLVFKPTLGFFTINPIVTATSPEEVVVAYKLLGAVFMVFGIVLFQVRWNTVHKLAALAFAAAGLFFGYLGHTVAGGFFVNANPFFLYGLVFLTSGLHIFFHSNKTYKELGWTPPKDK